jgi:hypothetical protein
MIRNNRIVHLFSNCPEELYKISLINKESPEEILIKLACPEDFKV